MFSCFDILSVHTFFLCFDILSVHTFFLCSVLFLMHHYIIYTVLKGLLSWHTYAISQGVQCYIPSMWGIGISGTLFLPLVISIKMMYMYLFF